MARATVEHVVTLSPDTPRGIDAASRLALDDGRLDEAERLLETAPEDHDGMGELRDALSAERRAESEAETGDPEG